MNKFTRKIMKLLPDTTFIKVKYFYHFRKFPNLKKPQTFNEKMQWLKLYVRKPSYSNFVDKWEAKKIIANIVGDEFLIPSYGVWDNFDDIDYEMLPDRFVLKTTHDCGGVLICKDKTKLDWNKAKLFFEKHLQSNYYYEGREWVYKNVKPRILAEAYMEDEDTKELRDYKLFLFSDEVKLLLIATERQSKDTETKFDYFDEKGNHLDFEWCYPNAKETPTIPATYPTMKKLARLISKEVDSPQLRIDFYEVNGKTYVGEITFYHQSGFAPICPEKFDIKLGEYIKLDL